MESSPRFGACISVSNQMYPDQQRRRWHLLSYKKQYYSDCFLTTSRFSAPLAKHPATPPCPPRTPLSYQHLHDKQNNFKQHAHIQTFPSYLTLSTHNDPLQNWHGQTASFSADNPIVLGRWGVLIYMKLVWTLCSRPIVKRFTNLNCLKNNWYSLISDRHVTFRRAPWVWSRLLLPLANASMHDFTELAKHTVSS